MLFHVIHAFLNPGHLPPLSPIGILWYVAGTIASLMFGSTVFGDSSPAVAVVCQLSYSGIRAILIGVL